MLFRGLGGYKEKIGKCPYFLYQPQTLALLPETVDFLCDLQVERLYLNPDYSAPWTEADCQTLAPIYAAIGDQYARRMVAGQPQYISLIDSKLAAIIKEGYAPHERCRMGQKEFAYSASGHIYPCERLIASGTENPHCIGHVSTGLVDVRACIPAEGSKSTNPQCSNCQLAPYCMNWCGCSNYFSTGRYDTVGAFLCASEKAAITTALDVFQTLEYRFGAEVFNRIIAVANPPRPTGPQPAD